MNSYEKINTKNNSGYYDLVHNRMTVRGFSRSDNAEYTKLLVFPGVIQNIYCITEYGHIYSIIDNNPIRWIFQGNLPYVYLTCMVNGNKVKEPFYVKDLVAYNYIASSSSYLERGYHVTNIDGNPANCYYQNVMYMHQDLCGMIKNN